MRWSQILPKNISRCAYVYQRVDWEDNGEGIWHISGTDWRTRRAKDQHHFLDRHHFREWTVQSFRLRITVHIFCIDEANSLLTKLSHPSKSAQNVNLPMERLCKCFDGDCWFILKGNKGKRSGVASARASILAFTTPRQFLSKA